MSKNSKLKDTLNLTDDIIKSANNEWISNIYLQHICIHVQINYALHNFSFTFLAVLHSLHYSSTPRSFQFSPIACIPHRDRSLQPNAMLCYPSKNTQK